MRVLWLTPLLFAGCPSSDGDPPAETDTDTDTDSDADTDTDSDTDADADTDIPLTSVTGTVLDTNGSPLTGVQVRFCRGELCLTPTVDGTGAFSIDEVQAYAHSFEVLVPTDPTRATGFSVVELQEGVPKAILMRIPPLDAPSPLNATAEWHAVGTGLRIQVGADDLETPPFLSDATQVAGVRVDPADYPTYDGLTNVHAMWFTSPFDYHAPNGLPIEIDNDMGLAPGGTYEVYVGVYESSEWVLAGTVTESGGVLTGTAELPLLSTVVLTDPQ